MKRYKTCHAIYWQKARIKRKDTDGSERLTGVCVCQWVKKYYFCMLHVINNIWYHVAKKMDNVYLIRYILIIILHVSLLVKFCVLNIGMLGNKDSRFCRCCTWSDKFLVGILHVMSQLLINFFVAALLIYVLKYAFGNLQPLYGLYFMYISVHVHLI